MSHTILNALLRRVGPRQFTALVNDLDIQLPRELRGIVVDGPKRSGLYFEAPAMTGLSHVLQPGSAVFDVGCSYGLITCLISKLIGPEGVIRSFDANPEVLDWARRVIALNCPQGQVQLVHACVGESSRGEATFYSVPGKASVASTRNSDINQFHRTASARRVPLLSLDDYAASAHVRPSCLKIDVEGSEYLVVRGASNLLSTAHPALIIETHGLEIDGIGGSLKELLTALCDLDYSLTDLTVAEPVSAGAFASRYSNRIGYLLAC